MQDFAAKLGALVTALGLSQSELSRRSGVPQTTISHYLRRTSKASWAHVQSLSKALGVSTDALTDDPAPPVVAPRVVSKRK